MANWQAFVAARDANAGMLWLLGLGVGAVILLVPRRWRWLAIVGMAVYAVVGVAWIL